MIVKDYMEILGAKFPGVQASIVGDPSVYENIELEEGSEELPSKETLDGIALDIAREEMWRKIQAERDIRKGAGIKVGENWFHSDDTSRIQQIALVMIGTNMPPGIMWKTMQGTFVQMSPTLASQIFQGIIAQDTKIFAQAEYHRQQMLASDDPLIYDCTTGWPARYIEVPTPPEQLRN